MLSYLDRAASALAPGCAALVIVVPVAVRWRRVPELVGAGGATAARAGRTTTPCVVVTGAGTDWGLIVVVVATAGGGMTWVVVTAAAGDGAEDVVNVATAAGGSVAVAT